MLQLGVCQVMPAVERHTVTGQTVSTPRFAQDWTKLHKDQYQFGPTYMISRNGPIFLSCFLRLLCLMAGKCFDDA